MRPSGRAGFLATVVALAVLVSACFAPAPAPPAVRSVEYGSVDAKTQEVFQRLNADRAAHGKPAVDWNNKLAGLAADWSAHMASTGNYGHRDLSAVMHSGSYGEFRAIAENILLGSCSMSAAQIQDAWMSSTGHRANILGSYNRVGIGLVCRGDGRLYATQNFGLV